jgi:protein arginine N-methyltransferase 1
VYTLEGFAAMIADRVRTEAYAQALRRSVKPGSVVLEIGTGPGIFAILACQLGASRVFAIESGEIIQIARENAAINHCADRIEFIEDFSTRVTLPAQADVVISDLHGALPLCRLHIPSIVDARRRFLAPRGVLIPREDKIWAAVVQTPELYYGTVGVWERNVLDQGLGAARRLATNKFHEARVKPEELLTAPNLWATLDYTTIESSDVRGELRWTVERSGTGHGIIVWFDSDLCDGVSFSNSPSAPRMVYGSLFFPWAHPVAFTPGETVSVQLEATLAGDDYVWRWGTKVSPATRSSEAREQFDQSTLAGVVFSPERLRKTASDYVPQLSGEGLLNRKILEMMDGRTTLEEIAQRLAADNPKRFPRWQDALSSAGALSRKYSR